MDQRKKEESSKINASIYGYLIYYKGSTAQWRIFSINSDDWLDSDGIKNKNLTNNHKNKF